MFNPLLNYTRALSNRSNLQVFIPAVVLTVLPASLGFAYIWFGILYTNVWRLHVFDFVWATFALFLITFAFFTSETFSKVVREISRETRFAFVVFAGVLTYTSVGVALDTISAIYVSLLGMVALLSGVASVGIGNRFGERFSNSIAWSLFFAMILHVPFIVWLYFIEGENAAFQWSLRMPGFRGIRPYNYLVEAGIAAGIGLYYAARNNNCLSRHLLLIGTTILWAALFWSGGRGGALALFVALMFSAIIAPKYIVKLWKFILFTVIAGAGISFFLPSPNGSLGILNRIGNTSNVTSGRIDMWLEAFYLFLQKPVLGHGISQYRNLTEIPKFVVHSHVHNILLDALLSFGVVGTAALVYLLGKLWLLAALNVRRTKSASALPMFLISTTLLAHGFVSGTYYHIHSQILIAISLGILFQMGGGVSVIRDFGPGNGSS